MGWYTLDSHSMTAKLVSHNEDQILSEDAFESGLVKSTKSTLISLITVTSHLPILENSTMHKTKIPPACLLILLQKYVVK